MFPEKEVCHILGPVLKISWKAEKKRWKVIDGNRFYDSDISQIPKSLLKFHYAIGLSVAIIL
jgi:hypothetical protein